MLCAFALTMGFSSHARAAGKTVSVVQTTNGSHMQPLTDLQFSGTAPPTTGPTVRVDDRHRYQRFHGIGGNLTDSSAWEINRLPPPTRSDLVQKMFGSQGDRLSYLRLPMGATDFTVGAPYSYDERPPGKSDPGLRHFSIRHDEKYIIPVLKQALAINPQLHIIASPWSAPNWMKTNHALSDIRGAGSLKPSAYRWFAAYFVKFIQAYARQGIHIEAITPQNEPGTWAYSPGMQLSVKQEARFINVFLRPALRRHGLHTRIYGYDASWTDDGHAKALARRTPGLAGIAWHCYAGNPGIMSAFHGAYRRSDEVVDECAENLAWFPEAMVAITGFRNWATSVAVWALVLNTRGGPVNPHNHCPGCSGAVEENDTTGALTYKRKFFDLGQVGHFVQENARRIFSTSGVTLKKHRGKVPFTDGIADVAFRNPDGSDVLVTYNTSGSPIRFGVNDSERGWFTVKVPPHATTTFTWS